jgi:uncharacterized protein
MTKNQIENKMRKQKAELRDRFKVEALYVFGSVANGSATASSDVDLIVDFLSDDVSLFEFLDLKIFLESVLRTKVDLVTRDAIKPSMKVQIEKQAVRVA